MVRIDTRGELRESWPGPSVRRAIDALHGSCEKGRAIGEMKRGVEVVRWDEVGSGELGS